MRYTVVIAKAATNHSAYAPDLPGCIATGTAVMEVEQQIQEAIAFHLDELQEDHLPIPEPISLCEYVEAS